MPAERGHANTNPEHDLILDTRSMRALAHPVRIRIMGLLRIDGPQTSTTLATKLGLNSGATSYHLRQLADQGLIVEDPELGTARERWWRAPSRSTFLDRSGLDDEAAEASMAYLRAVGLYYGEHLMRAIEQSIGQPEEWRRATSFNDYFFQLTAEEAEQLMADVLEVVGRYHRGHSPVPAGAEAYQLQLHGYPLTRD